MKILNNYALGGWVRPGKNLSDVHSAVTGEVVARTGSDGLDFGAMNRYAREIGGPALRALTFHQRAVLLKELAKAIIAGKEALYELSYDTGARRSDSWIDIEGGTGTLFTYASIGRRQLPNDTVLMDGGAEPLSKQGSFIGQHVFTSRRGVALHINAFNFPVWGMLEKLGPTLLAGVPAIVKPARATAPLCEATVRIMIETGLLPAGALQLVVGGAGDIFDQLNCQDTVSFTGSAATAIQLQNHPVMAREGVRFIAERDSLNAAILGPDAVAGTPEFDLFAKEVAREMTVKAGQKCTAIRRILAPRAEIDAVQAAIADRLGNITVGDPCLKEVQMGPLATQAQRDDVRACIARLCREARIVFGDPDKVEAIGADAGKGAFMGPVLLRCDEPMTAGIVHSEEAFGPVATIMPYDDLDQAAAIANRGGGALVMSLFTHDPAVARHVLSAAGAFHGRLYILDRDSAGEGTGHGAPLPMLVHGGPGRAGGGEEMGGLRGVKHYMQRTALQGSPRLLSGVTNRYLPGAPRRLDGVHPFRLHFDEARIGDAVQSDSRTITADDVAHFAQFTGDTFYAHTDDEAAAANPFFPGRVAHGYLLLSFAAGLFVDPAPGPVLANYGLESLRFLKPVIPGDAIKVTLTVKAKSRRSADYGEVTWDVEIRNQHDEVVAAYDLLTMTAIKGAA